MPNPVPPAPPAVTVASAIETLVAELEREHGWLAELREDARRAERTCQRLFTAVEAALDTLSVAERRPFLIRVVRMRNETRPLGRPPRDPRRAATLEFLAERREGAITNAETRAHLERLGHDANPGYVGRLLATLAEDQVVTRLSMGRYAVNGSHPKLQNIRWRMAFETQRTAAKAETARLMAYHEEREKGS